MTKPKLRLVTLEECEIKVICKPESLDYTKQGYDEAVVKSIEDAKSDWGWCEIEVVVSWERYKASTFLGCCIHEDEKDFRENSGYFEDMCKEALHDLNTDINNGLDEIWALVNSEK